MPDPSAYLIDDMTPILIGEVAEITGASRKAIRHYEAIKLLPPPTRRGTYRTYTSQHVFMVHVIRHAQSYGFTLDELRELIGAISLRGGFPIDVGLDVVRLKRASVRRELEALRALDKRLGLLLTDIKKHFG